MSRVQKQAAELLRKQGVGQTYVLPSNQMINNNLGHVLEDELSLSWKHYYQLELAESDNLLAGRVDPPALALSALLANSANDEKKMKHQLERLLLVAPDYRLPVLDYPPHLRQIFSELPRINSAYPMIYFSLGAISVPMDEFPKWIQRFQAWMKQEGWDEILFLALEPIGWNYQLSCTRLGKKIGKTYRVEMKDLNEIKNGLNILIGKAYFVDTSSHIQ